MATNIDLLKDQALLAILKANSPEDIEKLRIHFLGRKGVINALMAELPKLPQEERGTYGKHVNAAKLEIANALEDHHKKLRSVALEESRKSFFDVTAPSIKPPQGHLHLITQAIEEIAQIFTRIGFALISYPEIDYDWYAFESLNMPVGHAARDEWETFFIDSPRLSKMGEQVLTPHTSNGQVREMERLGKPPIRMINIGKTYRRQSDVSHSPMFHQFEGLAVGEGIGIPDLKGTIDYFVSEYFGSSRKYRLRPFHFQFTEPSFEIDISCDICQGSGCRLCKEGWLELGGSGITHPLVLKNGGIDPDKYTAFAFGWGVERVLMMREGINIPDLRLLYTNDVRFLEQF